MEPKECGQQYQYAVYHDRPDVNVAIGYGAYGSTASGTAGDADADAEGQAKGLSFDNKTIRRGFIRKVYMILMGQLVITFGAVALFVFSKDAKQFAVLNQWLFWVAIGVLLITMLSMVCCEKVRRETPTNFIFLGMFTIAESFLLGVSAIRFAPNEVLLAIGITAAICLALTVFALQTKYDFTLMGGILVACLVALLIFGFMALFMHGKIISLIYSSLSAVLFSIYLVYDTQIMMGGGHKYSISPEEYIFATLNLYLDIINIFIDVLNILGITQD
ncbi:protein lifeguard 1 [Drosophila hydei]|uniref:Protein lifeguard 1 n=1 Tax=Drosophila hydei TaxID=7224 RepID=A0A6J1LEN3_DROHY|nr:protein lifeguard 1 [Drosophila hydei]XP_030080797.1 protein lifeguard 1 [Drosophila hydei]